MTQMLRTVLDVTITDYGVLISLTTAFIINRISYCYQYFPYLYPVNIRRLNNEFKCWKWRNFFISFIHSIITGVGALLCAIYKPLLLYDVIEAYLEAVYILTSVSHGYFIYDTIEMMTHIHYKGSKELILHHFMILMCFSITVTQHKYCGYNTLALLIELSNIFLHFRQLLLLADIPKSNTIYRINSVVNIVMFVVVRGLCLFGLWLTLILVLPKVPIVPKVIAITSLVCICLMTFVLFMRIVVSDYNNKKCKQSNGETNKSNGFVPNKNSLHSKSS